MPETYLSRTGWTASASSSFDSGYLPANTLDDNTATIWHSGNGAGVNSTLSVDMQTAQDFDFIDLVPRQDSRTDPKKVELYVSNDGSNWTTSSVTLMPVSDATTKRIVAGSPVNARYFRLQFVEVHTGNNAAVAELKPGTGGIAAVQSHRYWRLYVLSASGSPYLGFAEIELRSSSGGSDLTGSGTVSASVATGVANTVDNNTGTAWGTFPSITPQWWSYDFGLGVSHEIVELYLTPRQDGFHNEAPGNFHWQYSDDGSNWNTAKASVTTSWPTAAAQTFWVGIAAPGGGGAGAAGAWLQANRIIDMYRKNTAGQNLAFVLLNATTGAGVTGATVSGYRSIDGGTQAAVTGTISEKANGQYNLALSAADCNGNQIGFLFTATGAVPVSLVIVTTVDDPTTGTAAGTAAAVWAYAIETSWSALEATRVMLSALAGKVSGANTTSIVFRDVGDTKPRISATVDQYGNRNAITHDKT